MVILTLVQIHRILIFQRVRMTLIRMLQLDQTLATLMFPSHDPVACNSTPNGVYVEAIFSPYATSL